MKIVKLTKGPDVAAALPPRRPEAGEAEPETRAAFVVFAPFVCFVLSGF